MSEVIKYFYSLILLRGKINRFDSIHVFFWLGIGWTRLPKYSKALGV